MYLCFIQFEIKAQDSATIYVMPSAIRHYGITAGYNIKINSVPILANSEKIKIKVHHPNFDTLSYSFGDTLFSNLILTRYIPDSIYCITTSCCDHFDVFIERKAKQLEAADSFEVWDSLRQRIRSSQKVKPMLNRRIKKKDSTAIVFQEASGFPYLVYYNNFNPTQTYHAPKGYYYSNESTIHVSNASLLEMDKENIDFFYDSISMTWEDMYNENKVYNSFTFRFHHDEVLLVYFDPRTKKSWVEIEE